jgi:hypothetical protein
MSDEGKITISVERERVLEACVSAVLGHGRYEYDDDDGGAFSSKMQKLVEKRIGDHVDELIDTIAREQIEALVGAQIAAVAAEGFPVFDRDGCSHGREPFAAYVRKAIDGMFSKHSKHNNFSSRSQATTLAEEAFRVQVQAAFQDEIEAVRTRVREYVDEQLAGTVVKALREAVGLRS